MTVFTKKILVLIPVVVLTAFFVLDHYASTYQYASRSRLMLFALTLGLLYTWIIGDVYYRKQQGFVQMGIQSSFYLYIFMVLTLTGYFILFREVSIHNWWDRMELRVERKDHVNLTLFKIFRIYKPTSVQVLGNLVMLLPLGIYLPLLYKWSRNFFLVVLFSFFASLLIELLQLATRVRSADVDDIMLNTIGAAIGFILYRIGRGLFTPTSKTSLAMS